MSSDMLLSPVSSFSPTKSQPPPPPLVSLPAIHSPPNAAFPALPFVAYSSSSRSRCSACHQPLLMGDIRVDCLHLDCVSSAHVAQWVSFHPQLARSFMRLPSLAALLPEDRRRAALLLHTLSQQCLQRTISPPSGMLRPPALQPLVTTQGEHLPSIREDAILSPPPSSANTRLPSPLRIQRQRTAPHATSPQHSVITPTHAAFSGGVAQAVAWDGMGGACKRKRVASDGSVQVVEDDWCEPVMLPPEDVDNAMVGVVGGSGRKKRRRSREYVSMLT